MPRQRKKRATAPYILREPSIEPSDMPPIRRRRTVRTSHQNLSTDHNSIGRVSRILIIWSTIQLDKVSTSKMLLVRTRLYNKLLTCYSKECRETVWRYQITVHLQTQLYHQPQISQLRLPHIIPLNTSISQTMPLMSQNMSTYTSTASQTVPLLSHNRLSYTSASQTVPLLSHNTPSYTST